MRAVTIRGMAMPVAPPVTNGVYPDEYIEYWGERYAYAGIGIRGVTFAQYLANPSRYDNGDRSLDPLPLNGRQRRVQRALLDAELAERAKRVEADVAHLPRRDGRIVEVLHHHRHPRSTTLFIKRAKP